MSVLGMLAWGGAAVSLWLGARGHASAVARGYRWLALAALGWCAGLIIQQAMGGTLNPGTGLSLGDLLPLLAVAGTAIGIALLTTAEREPPGEPAPQARADGPVTSSILPGLADGYVMAVALLVIGWVTLFSSEFHRSGERPGTFLLALIHPLADLAVLGALLPLVTSAWRRVMLPYVSLLAVAVGDALAVGQRVSGGHLGIAAQLMAVIAAVLLGLAPWRTTESRWTRRTSGSAAATIIAALAACVGTLVVIGYGLAGVPVYGVVLVVAGGAGVLVLAARVFMLVGQNGMVLRIWRESSRNLRELANQTSDVVLVCDLVGVIGYASPEVQDFGYPPRDLVGRRLLDFVHPEDRLAALAAFRRALSDHAAAEAADSAGTAHVAGAAGAQATAPPRPSDQSPAAGRFQIRVRTADGTWHYIESTVLPYQVPGQDGQLLVTARDVSDQVALRQQVTHLTFHDGLTGLPNRAYVEERARDVLRDLAAGRRAGVIFLDLDRFTAVNDSVGHGAGDLVLAQAARRLRAVVPAHDTVARWGSDEFAVLVESATGVQEIAELAERLAGAVAAEPFRVAGQQITLTASAGVAIADPAGPKTREIGATRGDGAELVLRNADVAMSRAKDAGGDRVEVYAAHMHADAVRRLEIVSDLQRAISQGELALQYQPIVDLASSRVTGAEALVRWWRGDQMVPPREFLDAAEESGLIVPLGEWVLREACAQAAAWRECSWDLGVSVNLSARQIAAPGFAALVAAILAEAGLPAGALTVEVNERILVEGNGNFVDTLADLRRLGIRLAVDNFGTGYASLAHLRRLPLDIIKIAPSFVAGLGHDDTLTLLTRTVVQVGRELGLRVIAEGIEQPRQLLALREMGCGYGQGFLIAGPMPVPGMEALIRTAAEEEGGRSVSECETTPVSG